MSESVIPKTITEDSNSWIEEAIAKNYFKYYEYDNFSNIEEVGFGNFGKVYRAKWKSSPSFLALKTFFNFNSTTIREVVNELKLQREVDFHENIIRFFGITTQNQNDNSIKYWLVMEYADSGTLQEYLKEHFHNLTWENKIILALQLAHAVLCLHDERIVHRDLHSKNVLIHQNTIKLADFGLSKRIDEAYRSRSDLFGVIPYMDPKKFNPQQYSLNKKSDIYSMGVLLWEISSGHPPFEGMSSYSLIVQISKGRREKPFPGTPTAYINLYTECWNDEPDNRPTIDQVVDKLKIIKSNQTNIDFGIVTDELVDLYEKVDDQVFEQNIFNYLNNYNMTLQEIYDWLLNNDQKDSNSIFLLGVFNYSGIGISTNKKKAFKLYQKSADLGNTFGMNNLGYCYARGICTDTDYQKAFALYQKAADLGNALGLNNLGYCYDNGIGTDIDYQKAFELYHRSADLGNVFGINNLGYCYNYGIGTDVDYQKAFELYQNAANLGYNLAQYNIALMYENGEGVVKSMNQAIIWYKKSAEQGNKNAQNKLKKKTLKK
ncbi:hypothetical protein RclHR1_01080023 [Rhizophagus clarus]|uniref:Kinase-like domain-containing protein n=1 Tax=Rhizophagus clarus TaxID=94130 RepID=A0A2Z6Q2V0_9GLOM|nr:hypothetical protein RclHR1_01080023 [Rhizophagus clarus]GES90973.1 kinase-like domain-containing protein [Rhizophagus clarus]